MSDDFTPDQTDRLLTLVFDPSPVASVLDTIGLRLCAYSERVAGYTDADVVAGTNPRNLWPRRALLTSWAAHRLDLLAIRATARRAQRRR